MSKINNKFLFINSKNNYKQRCKNQKLCDKISTMIHVIEHATIDSLKLLPLLFLAYVFVEVVEHIATPKLSSRIFLGKLAPLIGAGVGVIPQCGLSVVASNLYSKNILLWVLYQPFIFLPLTRLCQYLCQIRNLQKKFFR